MTQSSVPGYQLIGPYETSHRYWTEKLQAEIARLKRLLGSTNNGDVKS